MDQQFAKGYFTTLIYNELPHIVDVFLVLRFHVCNLFLMEKTINKCYSFIYFYLNVYFQWNSFYFKLNMSISSYVNIHLFPSILFFLIFISLAFRLVLYLCYKLEFFKTVSKRKCPSLRAKGVLMKKWKVKNPTHSKEKTEIKTRCGLTCS